MQGKQIQERRICFVFQTVKEKERKSRESMKSRKSIRFKKKIFIAVMVALEWYADFIRELLESVKTHRY